MSYKHITSHACERRGSRLNRRPFDDGDTDKVKRALTLRSLPGCVKRALKRRRTCVMVTRRVCYIIAEGRLVTLYPVTPPRGDRRADDDYWQKEHRLRQRRQRRSGRRRRLGAFHSA